MRTRRRPLRAALAAATFFCGELYRAASIAGTASVLPQEPGSTARIASLDMASGQRVAATATFTVECPLG